MAEVAFFAEVVVNIAHARVWTVVPLVAVKAGCLVERRVECASVARVLLVGSDGDVTLDYGPIVG